MEMGVHVYIVAAPRAHIYAHLYSSGLHWFALCVDVILDTVCMHVAVCGSESLRETGCLDLKS